MKLTCSGRFESIWLPHWPCTETGKCCIHRCTKSDLWWKWKILALITSECRIRSRVTIGRSGLTWCWSMKTVTISKLRISQLHLLRPLPWPMLRLGFLLPAPLIFWHFIFKQPFSGRQRSNRAHQRMSIAWLDPYSHYKLPIIFQLFSQNCLTKQFFPCQWHYIHHWTTVWSWSHTCLSSHTQQSTFHNTR